MPESVATPALWIGFHAFVVVALLLDLFVLHKDERPVRKREALAWSIVWVSLSVMFGGGLWWGYGANIGMEFFAAYTVEKSLSVDNLFVFLLIFAYFKVPANVQHRVLFWGVFGAIVLRALMIFLGVALISRFGFLMLGFAAILIWSSLKLLITGDDDDDDLTDNRTGEVRALVAQSQRQLRRLEVRDRRRWGAPLHPLALVLVVIELSDLLFAVDSIPAVFGVATDPFVIYSSNICAILGLRALYFLLAAALSGLRFLGPCLGLILGFVGVKMVLAYFDVHIHVGIALSVVAGLLAAGVVLSLLFKKPPEEADGAPEKPADDVP